MKYYYVLDLATSILAPVLSSILVAVVCLIIIVAALVLVGARRKMKMKLVQEELEFQLDCLRYNFHRSPWYNR